MRAGSSNLLLLPPKGEDFTKIAFDGIHLVGYGSTTPRGHVLYAHAAASEGCPWLELPLTKPLSALCIRTVEEGRSLVCAACDTSVILCHLDGEVPALDPWRFELPSHVKGSVSVACADASGLLVALCVSSSVCVLQAETGAIYAELEGSGGTITAATFGAVNEHLFYTASEGGTIMVWDLAMRKLVYRSAVLCGSASLTAVAVGAHAPAEMALETLAASAGDDRLWLFHVDANGSGGGSDAADSGHTAAGVTVREVRRVDLRRAVRNAVSPEEEEDGENGWVESRGGPLALAFDVYRDASPPLAVDSGAGGGAFGAGGHVIDNSQRSADAAAAAAASLRRLHLWVAFSFGVVFVDVRTGTVAFATEISDLSNAAAIAGMPGGGARAAFLLPFARQIAMADIVASAAAAAFIGGGGSGSDATSDGNASADGALLLFASARGPMPQNSPLRRELEPVLPQMAKESLRCKDSGGTGGGRGNGGGAKKASAAKVLPVMFHARVRSSGYGGSTLPAPMFSWRKPAGSDRAGGTRNKPAVAAGTTRPMPGKSPCTGTGETSPGSTASGALMHCYPTHCSLLRWHQSEHNFPPRSESATAAASLRPILSIAFSRDARRLAVATTEEVVLALHLPVARHGGSGDKLLGHGTGPTGIGGGGVGVNAVCAGHDSTLLLSASADGTARLWVQGSAKAALVFGRDDRGGAVAWRRSDVRSVAADNADDNNDTADTGAALPGLRSRVGGTTRRKAPGILAAGRPALAPSSTVAPPAAAPPAALPPVARACFMYLDRFVLLARGGAVDMIAYRLPNGSSSATAAGTAPRKLSDPRLGHCAAADTGGFRLMHRWALGAQTATWVDCANGLLSPLVFACSSDRSIHILDAAVGGTARVIRDAHAKAVHSLALPPSAAFGCVPAAGGNGGTGGGGSGTDIFLTAAADGVAALWDLRQDRRCSRLAAHTNHRGRVGLALSPCLRYAAVGSEDRACYLYDLRTGGVAARLIGHGGAVTAAAFNPLRPQLATGSLDGTVRFWGEEAASAGSDGGRGGGGSRYVMTEPRVLLTS